MLGSIGLKIVLVFAVALSGNLLRAQSLKLQELQQSAEQTPAPPYELKTWILSEAGTQKAFLMVSAKMSEGSYLHSLTQQGPSQTMIEVAVSDDFRITGPFRPTKAPKVIDDDPLLGGRIEKHFETVEFFLPIEIAAGKAAEDLTIDIRVNGQVCTSDSMCMQIRDQVLTARFGDLLMRTDERYGALQAAKQQDANTMIR
ncbi:MAG: hypothetical protein R3C03_09865 [Pirellulaceae bacterium]